MRTLFLFLALSIFLACGKKETTTTEATATTTAPVVAVDTTPPPPGWWIKDVATGYELARNESIPPGKVGSEFKSGAPVHLSMKVSEAPPDSSIKVSWYGPSDIVISEENKLVIPSQENLSFTVPATIRWKPGTYRADIWTGGQKVKSQEFQIVN